MHGEWLCRASPLGGLQSFGFGTKLHFAALGGAAQDDAIHATFYRQVLAKDEVGAGCADGRTASDANGLGLSNALGQSATPFGRTVEAEVDGVVGQGATAAFGIEYLHLDQCKVGTVGLPSQRILDGCQLDVVGRACRSYHVVADIAVVDVAYGTQFAGNR